MVVSDPTFDPASFIASARKQMNNDPNNTTLAQAFATATAPQPFPNFWQVGCVFDTILDYFLTLKESSGLNPGDQTLMAQLLAQAVTGYQYGIVGLSAAWYDDWSWWGIAASKAFDPDYEEIFGDQLGFFQSAAMDLWGLVDEGDFPAVADSIPANVWANSALQCGTTQFSSSMLSARSDLHTGTRNAWALIQRGAQGLGTYRQNADYAHFTTQTPDQWAAPRFSGGCWQYDLSTWAFYCNDGPDWTDPDPATQTLGVFQVTLMSGLYLSFCCGLIAAAERKAAENKSGGAWDRLQSADTYRQSAGEVVGFLTSWLELPQPDSLATAFPQGLLVHERTPTYAELDGSYPPLQGYYPNAYWAGDQGLIMGALKQYEQLAGAASPANLDSYVASLLTGVFYNMPSSQWSPPNAVGPYLDLSGTSPISGDPNDYESGSGIFWRYVMRCCRLDPAFAAQARNSPTIVAMAINSGKQANEWGNSLFQPFNGVAAAIGAWYLLAGPGS
jgi:hypothetical protein